MSQTVPGTVTFTTNTSDLTKPSLSVVSSNGQQSAMWLSGCELAHGTLKISHVGDAAGGDANAAALSIDLTGPGTAAQGLYLTASGVTTGYLLNVNNGDPNRPLLRLGPRGHLLVSAPPVPFDSASQPHNTVCVTLESGVPVLTAKDDSGVLTRWKLLPA